MKRLVAAVTVLVALAAATLALAQMELAGGRAPARTPGLPLPDPGAPMPTAEPGTALFHAQSCARYLGPIPAMSCSKAQVVPITVDGVEVFDEPATCDRPAALTGGCQPGNGIGRKQGTHYDGSPRPEVIFMNFCLDGGINGQDCLVARKW